jgi:spermidine synthase
MRRSPLPVATLLFASGFCALVYQTTWMRQFRLIFGASTLATAAVLAIFMAGLGVGSALLGKRADRTPNPLRMYGLLELLIAGSAAVSPLLLWIIGKVYIALGGSVTMGLAGATIVRLILSSLVLVIPTVLMGGTLPAAARAIETSTDVGRRGVALLYGLNTLGAVTGTVVTTFFLLEAVGNRSTLFLAVAVNAAVGLIALRLAGNNAAIDEAAEADVRASLVPPRLVLFASAVVGFAFLLMELVWYRMLAPILGGSTFTFGLILAMALLGIAIGGAAYSFWGGGGAATPGGFALTCTLEAAAIMLPYALGDRVALLADFLRVLGHAGFGGHLIGWTIVTAIVVLPPSIIAGVQFPLLIALLGRGHESVGRHVGQAYAWNTAGAIVGSLAGGFGFLPLFTAPACWQLASLLLIATGVAAAVYAVRNGQRAAALGSACAAVLAIAFGAELGPTPFWRHSGIGAGRADMPVNRTSVLEHLQVPRAVTVWEEDGRESAVALIDDGEYAFFVNGKSDGAARGDAGTQVMSGLVGSILHPNPKRAFVVGLGTGSSAGWLGAVPSIERVNVVELEPAVLRVARDCTPVNHDVLHNPKVQIRIADAREVLLTSRDRYDVVFSEPSNPYRAGIASLFTREFYEAVATRLSRDGIFVQWVQSYDIDTETVRTIYATIGGVFPHVDTWRAGERDLLFVATREPLVIDMNRLRQRVAMEPYRTALHVTWRVESAEGFLSHFLASDHLTRAASRGATINTDDRPVIEFGFARTVGDNTRFAVGDIISTATAFGAQRPERVVGTVDWQLVLLQRATLADLPPVTTVATPEEKAHYAFAVAWDRQDLRGALASWTQSGRWPPVNTLELAAIAEVLADNGIDDATRYAEVLRRWQPVEADLIESRLALNKGQLPESTALLLRALARYRTDPWPLPELTHRSLQSSLILGQSNDKKIPAALYEAFSHPFVIGLWDQMRRNYRIAHAHAMESCGKKTTDALLDVEPWPRWNPILLTMRAECYEKAGLHEMAAKAKRQLEEWQELQPQPLARK